MDDTISQTAGADSSDANDNKKTFTSKRTLAIVYAALVLAFAAGLIWSDGDLRKAEKPAPVMENTPN